MNTAPSPYFLLVERISMLLLLSYPTLMLTVKGGMNGALLLLLLLALLVSMIRPKGIGKVVWQPDWTPYLVAMLAMSLAVLISQIAQQNVTGHPHDAASRYWLAVPVFLLLQRARLQVFSVLPYSFPLAAMVGLLFSNHASGGRAGIATLDLIHYGDFEVLLAVMSLLSIDMFGRDKFVVRLFKISGFMAGLFASFDSGSRGGWLAIPVFILIFIYMRGGKKPARATFTALFATCLCAAALFLSNSSFNQRVMELGSDVRVFTAGDKDTSTGVRLQLYRAAVTVFVQQPLFGVGPEGFAREMQPLQDAGKLTPMAADLGRGEVHNDFLSKAAGMGIFGALALLAIYLVPLRLFWRASKSAIPPVKRAGLLGVAFVSGTMVFGLTVEFLNLTLATAFYSTTVAILLAVCYNIYHPNTAVSGLLNKDLSHV